MTDVWSERAEAYRESATHSEGPDLDLLVEWCEPGDGVRRSTSRPAAGTSRGGCARRAATSSPSTPRRGCRPTSSRAAEDLPFADGSFDVVACRIAPHHFDDVRAAVARDGARHARPRGRAGQRRSSATTVEEAEKLRDPTHVRCYSEDEWRGVLRGGRARRRGRAARSSAAVEVEPWLARVETPARRRRARARAARRPDRGRPADAPLDRARREGR